jgi:hypothetical protein
MPARRQPQKSHEAAAPQGEKRVVHLKLQREHASSFRGARKREPGIQHVPCTVIARLDRAIQ